MDCTVWPKNDNVSDCLQVLQTVCSVGASNVGFVQLPLVHSQTTQGAVVKRKRLVEDFFLKADCDFSASLTLVFSKEGLRVDTGRPSSQPCFLVTVGKCNKWAESQAFQTGIVGPLQLAPTRDLLGYDPENRPGAAARVEQSLVCKVNRNFGF